MTGVRYIDKKSESTQSSATQQFHLSIRYEPFEDCVAFANRR